MDIMFYIGMIIAAFLFFRIERKIKEKRDSHASE